MFRRCRIVLVLFAVAVLSAPAARADNVLILGDSLSKEYALEFLLDGYPSSVQNWVEILQDRRNADMDSGGSDFVFDSRFLYTKQEYNWAIPGGKISDFQEIVNGVTAADRSARSSIAGQLQSEVDRFVLFVGGNDSDSHYGAPYNNTGDWDVFIASFTAGVEEVLDWAMAQNVNLEFVLVNVPHVGITPKVKGEYPPDPVKTGRVTAEYVRLNGALRQIADARGIGYADIFTETLDLLSSDPLCIQGVPFINEGSTGGDLDYVWLAGNLSDNFHPNTNGCVLIANRIIEAFNRSYGAGIKLLTTEEMLENRLGKNADITLAEWLTGYGLAGALATDDLDGDGLDHLAEFGLGLDPRKRDEERAPSYERTGDDGGGTPVGALTYRPRLSEASTVVEVTGQASDDLSGWEDAAAGETVMNADGSLTFQVDAGGRKRFQRVVVRLIGGL